MKIKKFFLTVVMLAGMATVFVAPMQAMAECTGFDPNDPYGVECGEASGLSEHDPRTIVARIINVALSILGILVTIIILYAGFKYMTAGGNEEEAKKARSILFAAIIGLIIILSAYAISQFVLTQLYQATTGQRSYP